MDETTTTQHPKDTAPQQARVRTALVIGGGIAGPVVATALQRVGIRATVCEAYAGTADGVGGGMGFAPNGLEALDAVGIGDAVRAVSTPMEGMVIESWNGKHLGEFGNLPGVPAQRFVQRSDLYRVLNDAAEAAGVTTLTGRRLVDAADDGAQVTARFEDGSTATADLLIGADGIHSTARRLIDPSAPDAEYAGTHSFGGWVEDSGLPDTGGKMHMSFGKRAFLGWQVFEDGRCLWFVNLPSPTPVTLAEQRVKGAEFWLRTMVELFREDVSPAVRLLERTDPEELMFAGSMEFMPSVPTWSRGRMVLVGDAVHAPSSSSGQGASLAIESAVQLARCLRDLPVDRALAAYEELRRPRVERITKATARTNARKAAGPVGRVVRDALLPLMFKLMKPEKSAWQYVHPIDFAAPVA